METRRILTRIPPQNTDSEKSLLGSILLSPGVMVKVSQIIKPSAFYKEQHTIIYMSILEMYIEKREIDIITLSDNLRNKNQLDKIGGMSYLAELASTVPTASNSEHYAVIIQDKYSRRQLIQLSEKIANAAYDETVKMKDALQRTQKALKEVEKISIGMLHS